MHAVQAGVEQLQIRLVGLGRRDLGQHLAVPRSLGGIDDGIQLWLRQLVADELTRLGRGHPRDADGRAHGGVGEGEDGALPGGARGGVGLCVGGQRGAGTSEGLDVGQGLVEASAEVDGPVGGSIPAVVVGAAALVVTVRQHGHVAGAVVLPERTLSRQEVREVDDDVGGSIGGEGVLVQRGVLCGGQLDGHARGQRGLVVADLGLVGGASTARQIGQRVGDVARHRLLRHDPVLGRATRAGLMEHGEAGDVADRGVSRHGRADVGPDLDDAKGSAGTGEHVAAAIGAESATPRQLALRSNAGALTEGERIGCSRSALSPARPAGR